MMRQSSLAWPLAPLPPDEPAAPPPILLLPNPAKDVFLLRFGLPASSLGAAPFALAALADRVASAEAWPGVALSTASSRSSFTLIREGLRVASEWLGLCLKRGRGVAVVDVVVTTGEEWDCCEVGDAAVVVVAEPRLPPPSTGDPGPEAAIVVVKEGRLAATAGEALFPFCQITSI